MPLCAAQSRKMIGMQERTKGRTNRTPFASEDRNTIALHLSWIWSAHVQEIAAKMIDLIVRLDRAGSLRVQILAITRLRQSRILGLHKSSGNEIFSAPFCIDGLSNAGPHSTAAIMPEKS